MNTKNIQKRFPSSIKLKEGIVMAYYWKILIHVISVIIVDLIIYKF